MTLGEKLKKARQATGMSQSAVCGDRITRNMLSQLENDLASPSVGTLEYLADVLGVTVGWLLEDDPAAETLERAREAFGRGEYRTCITELRQSAAARTEEGKLLLLRSALQAAEDAADDGRCTEAKELAALGAELCGKSLYAGRSDRLRADAVLLRCAMEQGTAADELVRTVRADYDRMNLSEDCHLLMARYALSCGHLQAAARELLAVGEPSPRGRGEWLLLSGLTEMAQSRWDKAEALLHGAEGAPVLTRAQRRELYRLLEKCSTQREDYKQAYYYASRQRQLEENEP